MATLSLEDFSFTGSDADMRAVYIRITDQLKAGESVTVRIRASWDDGDTREGVLLLQPGSRVCLFLDHELTPEDIKDLGVSTISPLG